MTNIFEKIFGKKKKEELTNNTNQPTNLNEQVNNNQEQNTMQPVTFNQNMNTDNQSMNPLGFQPIAPIENIQTNTNLVMPNTNPQSTEFNNQDAQPQTPTVNINSVPEQNMIPNGQQETNQVVGEPNLQSMPQNNNIQTNINPEISNMNSQPIGFNNQVAQPQTPMMNLNSMPQQNIMQNMQPTAIPSNEVNNVVPQQTIAFNQEITQPQSPSGTLNVIPTMGPTPSSIPNQNNITNQNI